jgi:AcrR family transcriptional regulator
LSGPGRPRIAARVEAQRTRILDAAQECFIGQGFHAASMATIAATAGMSAGLIYRYFEGKNAIVLAIIARELERARGRIAALHASTDLLQGLMEAFEDFQARSALMSAALLLEMSAEGTRVPQIAEALAASDAQVRADIAAWLARPPGEGGRGIAREEARRRALMMQLAVGGLILHAARQPALDRRELRQALAPLVAAFTAPPAPAKRRATA